MPLSHSKSTDVANTERLIIELIPFLKMRFYSLFACMVVGPAKTRLKNITKEYVPIISAFVQMA
jgi:hypothetical protein